MKLYIKQKVFSIKDKFSISDENGNAVFYCEGKVFSIGKKLRIFDKNNVEVAYIREKVWCWLPRYYIEKNGVVMATVKKLFTFVKPKYECKELGWQIEGNFLEHLYSIKKDSETIASISKKWFAWGDTYEIDVPDDSNVINALCLVIIIDAVNNVSAVTVSAGAS